MNKQSSQKRVLLVDDDCVVRMAHRKPLIDAGFIVEEAENGQQAIECFINHKGLFNIVLMDYEMPDMTGADVAKALRYMEANNQKIPIIAITTQVDEITKFICLNAGMNGILCKPLLQPQLTALVDQVA